MTTIWYKRDKSFIVISKKKNSSNLKTISKYEPRSIFYRKTPKLFTTKVNFLSENYYKNTILSVYYYKTNVYNNARLK